MTLCQCQRRSQACGFANTSVHTSRALATYMLPLVASQRPLRNAPIFRLLSEVAVNGAHQCDFSNFCGTARFQQPHSCYFNLCVCAPGSNNHTVVKLICVFVCAQGSNKHKVVNFICVCVRTTLVVHPCGRGNSAISDA